MPSILISTLSKSPQTTPNLSLNRICVYQNSNHDLLILSPAPTFELSVGHNINCFQLVISQEMLEEENLCQNLNKSRAQ